MNVASIIMRCNPYHTMLLAPRYANLCREKRFEIKIVAKMPAHAPTTKKTGLPNRLLYQSTLSVAINVNQDIPTWTITAVIIIGKRSCLLEIKESAFAWYQTPNDIKLIPSTARSAFQGKSISIKPLYAKNRMICAPAVRSQMFFLL